ncbi:MAG: hypothetical protein IKM59_00235, partial [Oscillospiraceae bacterium]|nr:hypothetical protein [Oscillospiraceae bacterium]
YKAWDVFVCGGKYMKAANTENNRYYLLTLCGETTQGTKPTIFNRGNRELRGFGAHNVIDSMGTSSTGDAYFYFTQPNIFGIVLDTGEYGADSLAQFGGTVRFQKYREKQTQWLRQIYAEGKWKDYPTRVVICHLPFTAYTDGTMKAVFKEWTNILNQMGVTLMVAGHVNNYSFYPVGDSRNVSGPNFPMLTMSDLDNGSYAYSGTYVTFNGKSFTSQNVTNTLAVRETKTVANPLYSEQTDLISNYTPTTDQNVLYFGFGNTLEDQQRYRENPVYGGANYDGNGTVRTMNFYKGGGVNYDVPLSGSSTMDNAGGFVRTKMTGPYATQASYTGCVTRRFVFGETNDTIASVGSLKFNPANAEVFQVRFKLENLKIRTDIDTVDPGARNRIVSLQYFRNSNTSATRNSKTYGGSYVNGEYMTVTLDLDNTFRSSDVITKILVEFHGFVKQNDSADSYVTLDYVYVGPRATMPSRDDGFLFLDFTDSAAAQYRYAGNTYGGTNFDLANNWRYNTGRSTAPSISGGAMSYTVLSMGAPWFETQKDGLMSGLTMNYNPANAEVAQIRVKYNSIGPLNGSSAGNLTIMFGGSSATEPVTYSKSMALSAGDIAQNDKWFIYVIPLNGLFTNVSKITGIRLSFDNLSSIGNNGTVSIDYIYVGPASKMPSPHTYEETVTAPTCTEDGAIIYTCTVCGTGYGKVLPATGHKEVQTPAHDPTCTVPGLTEGIHCENCGLVVLAQEEIPAAGHTTVTVPGTPAGCTTPGLTEGAYCDICELVLTEQTEIPATGHTVVTIPGISENCTTSGLTEGAYCSVCKIILTEPVEIPATGHSYTYTPIDNLSHAVGCESCDYNTTEPHTYENGTCICGEAEIKEPVTDETIVINHSLNLASDISINFVVEKAYLADYTDHYMVCDIPVYTGNALTGTRSVSIAPVVVGNFYYYTLTGVTAVQMGDVITAQLHIQKDGQPYLSKVDTYSIAQYAYAQLNRTSTADRLKKLCADLLRYGKEAQIYKSYRTDSLVDAAMTESHKAWLSDAESVVFGNTNTTLTDVDNPTVTWKGKALDLNAKVGIKYIVNLANYTGAVEDLCLKVSYVNYEGRTAEAYVTESEVYNEAGKLYAFTFDGLLAAELRTVVSAQIFAGETPVSPTLRYSADTYGNNKTGQLLTLCRALFAYSDTAKAYFG